MTCYTLFPVSCLLILICSVASSISSLIPALAVTVTGSHVVSDLPSLWSSNGFTPPDPHEKIHRFLSSNDMKQNLGLIGSLPAFASRREIRMDWMLDLVSIRRQQDNFVDYRFEHLDAFIDLLHRNNLRPGFKLMGNPSKFFTSFEDEISAVIWWDMVKSIATRYIAKYGPAYVREWNFETWKSPDKGDFDGINMTADAFSNYLESSYQGLLSASLSFMNNRTSHRKRDLPSAHLRFGGSAGKCVPMNNNSLCGIAVDRLIKKLSENDGMERLNLFFSFEQRGERRVSEGLQSILEKESLVLSQLAEKLPNHVGEVRVMNTEADSEPGWSIPREWQADVRYAALVAQAMALRVEKYMLSPKNDSQGPRFRLMSLNHENAYLSFSPDQFTQRTLLARFQVNSTTPQSVHFIKKPIFMVYGLMGLLGDQLVQHQIDFSDSSNVRMIASSAFDPRTNEKVYSFLLVNSQDSPAELSNSSVRVNLTMNFSLTDMEYEWKFSRYTVDNNRTNPFKVWKDEGRTPVLTDQLLSAMRAKSEPAIDVSSRDVDIRVSEDGFDRQMFLKFDLTLPAVTLVLICSKADMGPNKVRNLRGIIVDEFEVLLLWTPANSRCLRKYEVEFSNSTSFQRKFDRVSSEVLLFASFTHNRKDRNGSCEYRVRQVDMFGREGPFSDILTLTP